MDFTNKIEMRDVVKRGIRVNRPINRDNIEWLEAYICEVFYGILAIGGRELELIFSNKEALDKSTEYLNGSPGYGRTDNPWVVYAPNNTKITLSALIDVKEVSTPMQDATQAVFDWKPGQGNRSATLNEGWFISGDIIVTDQQWTDVNARVGRPPVASDFKVTYLYQGENDIREIFNGGVNETGIDLSGKFVKVG